MAQGLTMRAAALLVALGASSAGQAAHAQSLLDPTRPPQSGAASESASGAGPAATTRLQSVLLSPGRKLAVIDGQTVPLGGRVGDATVVEISPDHVVLRQGAEMRTLKLHPAAEKKPIARGSP
jgi:MSHA biogenesis protein MshK